MLKFLLAQYMTQKKVFSQQSRMTKMTKFKPAAATHPPTNASERTKVTSVTEVNSILEGRSDIKRSLYRGEIDTPKKEGFLFQQNN